MNIQSEIEISVLCSSFPTISYGIIVESYFKYKGNFDSIVDYLLEIMNEYNIDESLHIACSVPRLWVRTDEVQRDESKPNPVGWSFQ